MMKLTFLAVLLLAAQFVAAAEEAFIPPLKAIEKFGSISITDGSSFFTFSKDGSFRSGPLGESGREFDGRWMASNLTFTVTAKLGWMNGASTVQDYRRIVFVIYHVQKRPPETNPFKRSQPELFDSYFLIEELVKTPKPAEPNPR